jgi:hypothetical protein
MWGRSIGAFFYIPAGIMWAKGMFSTALKKRVAGMGLLLAFQARQRSLIVLFLFITNLYGGIYVFVVCKPYPPV